jgi:hypothetical protein
MFRSMTRSLSWNLHIYNWQTTTETGRQKPYQTILNTKCSELSLHCIHHHTHWTNKHLQILTYLLKFNVASIMQTLHNKINVHISCKKFIQLLNRINNFWYIQSFRKTIIDSLNMSWHVKQNQCFRRYMKEICVHMLHHETVYLQICIQTWVSWIWPAIGELLQWSLLATQSH